MLIKDLVKEIFGDTPEGCCVNCKAKFNFKPNCRDNQPGTVYSHAGMNETKISQLCETCFDNITCPQD